MLKVTDTSERIFRRAQNRTEWLKQFKSHEEYLSQLNKFTDLTNINKKHRNFYGDNIKVLVEGNNILQAIKY